MHENLTKLNASNEDYHKAINTILRDNSVDLELRVRLATQSNEVFKYMFAVRMLAEQAYPTVV